MADVVFPREQIEISPHILDEAPQGNNIGAAIDETAYGQHLRCDMAVYDGLGNQ